VDDGASFVAITDADTPLQKRAQQEGFWRTFVNPSDIGGRYSALSYFGLVPAALLGLDLGALVEHAEKVALASHARVPLHENLAVRLRRDRGGPGQKGGRQADIRLLQKLAPLGAGWSNWLRKHRKQTGASCRSMASPRGKTDAYGNDRLFVSLALASETHDMSYLAKRDIPASVEALGAGRDRGGILRWGSPPR